MLNQLGIFKRIESPEGVFEYRYSLIWLLCRSAVFAIKRIHHRLKLPTSLVLWCGRRAMQRRINGGQWRTILSDNSGRPVEVL